MYRIPESLRIEHPLESTLGPPPEGCGAFKTRSPLGNGRWLYVIASNGEGWEHVSVHVRTLNKQKKLPTWDEMCFVKATFWDDEDTVIQYHPAKSNYVNQHEFTLHLWRPIDIELPVPPKEMVGI